MTAQDAVMQRVLRGISQGDFNLSGVPDVTDLFNQLRNYRSQLPRGHALKECILPDEVSPSRPVRPLTNCQRIKLSSGR